MSLEEELKQHKFTVPRERRDLDDYVQMGKNYMVDEALKLLRVHTEKISGIFEKRRAPLIKAHNDINLRSEEIWGIGTGVTLARLSSEIELLIEMEQKVLAELTTQSSEVRK